MKKLLLLAFAMLAVAGTATAADDVLITGAGSTFVFPLFSKWFGEYNRAHPDVKINYQSIGSGGGIKQITEKTVHFGATDTPMTDAELLTAQGIVHIPVTMGAVVVTYNEPSLQALRLSPTTLADIFLGKIQKWNDPAIAADNPGVKLPEEDISVAHRSDGSGTTGVFTDYLSKVSPEWKSKIGAAKSVAWPAGLGGKGNEGVTGMVKTVAGAIGYVELAYANQNKLPTVLIKNQAGQFVKPSIESTSAAAVGADIPADYRASLTNAPGKDAYPIVGFTHVVVYKDSSDEERGRAFAQFLWWAVHDGQKSAGPLDYAPLPASLVKRLEATIRSLTVQGKPALAQVP